jgi:hypothetical protein
MSKVGRNAPCPCGSGRKYKHCCLTRPGRGRYTLADRASVRARLKEVCDGPLTNTFAEAERAFMPLEFDRDRADDPVYVATYTASRDAFESWFYYDEPFEDDGRPLIEILLTPTARLSSGERAYITSIARTTMRLYEVMHVNPGESLTLRDVIVGDEVTVYDLSSSRVARRKILMAARVIAAGASGQPEFDGHLLVYPGLGESGERERLVGMLQHFIATLRAKLPDSSLDDIFKKAAPFLHATWLDMVEEVLRHEIEPIAPNGVLFTTTEPARVAAVLDALPELDRVPGHDQWRWRMPGRDTGPQIAYATIELEGDELMLLAPTVERSARCRKRLEGALGSLIEYQETSIAVLEEDEPVERPSAHP